MNDFTNAMNNENKQSNPYNLNSQDKERPSEPYISIALDGPAGAGKSTIAKKLAQRLSYIYVDTGAMYRALAVYFLQKHIAADDEKAISAAVSGAEVTISHRDGQQHVFLNGEDVTSGLRTEEVSQMASKSSRYQAVRTHLLALQRSFAASHHVIMDGRDIGTVVLPHATLKIFLTASPEVRAERRLLQLAEQGNGRGETYEEILAEIKERDDRDSHRAIAPLKKSVDAVLVDTSQLSEEETEEAILAALKAKLSRENG